MGARQSRRSVDITTTPKKEGLPVEGVIIGDGAAPGDGKLEKIEEADAKPTTNGVAPHTEAAAVAAVAASTTDDKDKDKDEATEKEKEKDEENKAVEPKVEQSEAESAAEGVAATTAAATTTTEATTPTEGTPASPTTTTSPDSKETKKKDKPKKKWSFRSISFSRKDKNKPAREDAPKNGDVTKEEPLAEGGEEAEAAASSPAEDKSAVSSPTEQQELNGTATEASTAETKVEEEDKSATVAAPAATAAAAAATAAATVAANVADEKKEEPSTPAPTPVPVEAKKVEEVEKQQQQQVEPANADKTVEVSPVQAVIEAPVEVNSQSKQIATTATTATAPSIIERKTSEDFPSQFPSSPPPTPIDPSPLQQAQQVAANASAIAEALKLPAEAAIKAANIAENSARSLSDNLLSATPASASRPRPEISSDAPVTAVIAVTAATEQQQQQQQSPPPPPSPPCNNPVSSESPEQTGIASPLPVITTTITATTVTDITESPHSLTPTESLEQVVTNESPVEIVETEKPRGTSPIIEVEKETPVPAVVIPDSPLEVVKESTLPVFSRTDDNDESVESAPLLVDSTEPDEVKLDEVISDSRVEEIKTVEVPTESEKNVESDTLKEDIKDEVVNVVDEVRLEDTLVEMIAPVTKIQQQNGDEISEKDIPPPLPDSPVPVPKVTNQLLNFITTQIEEAAVIPEIIENPQNLELAPQENLSSLSQESPDIIEMSKSIETIDESHPRKQQVVHELENCFIQPEEILESPVDQLPETVVNEHSPPAPQEIIQLNHEEHNDSCPSSEENVDSTKITITDTISESTISSAAISVPQIPTETTLLTPPRSPSPPNLSDTELATKESSKLDILYDQSNREFKVESMDQSLNSHNDSELELKERLAESLEEKSPANCHLSYAVQENHQVTNVQPPGMNHKGQPSIPLGDAEFQSTPEADVPVENNIVANDIGTTENNDEAPKSPPPAIPAEAPPAATLGPAITEDVASVTKAIEEIDINEKAVAAAVNENESANTNEIMADMNHHNNMNE